MRLVGRLERHRHGSRLLEGNPLGDPTERDVYVYLPPAHERAGPLPWVMVLAGYSGTNHSLLNYSFFEPNVVERFDRLVASGGCRPAMLVLPDAINRWGGSQFLDSAATGRYQSYLADEVVDFVEGNFDTAGGLAGRAVVGRSSGGFGALRLGLDRPDRFVILGSHAGDSAFETSILPELRDAAIAYRRAGGLASFVEAFQRGGGAIDFTALMILAYAAAYAPQPDAPYPHVALPFDVETAEILPAVWRRFIEHDPVERLRGDPQALSDARFVYLDAGDRDEHGLQFGAQLMARALTDRGVAVRHEQFEGGHRGTGHRYEISLPMLVDACYRGLE